MDPSPIGSIFLIFILILANVFFIVAHMSIESTNKNKIKVLAKKGNKSAQLLKKILKEPTKVLTTIEFSSKLTGFFASALAAITISDKISLFLKNVNIPYGREFSIVLITVILTYITMILVELTRKKISNKKIESVAMLIIRPVIFISKVLYPLVYILVITNTVISKLLGIKDIEDKKEANLSKDELKSLINVGQEVGILDKSEKKMLQGVFEFDHKTAREVMTPRTDVFAINFSTNTDVIAKTLISEQFSRIPVYKENTDNIIGILYLKDFFEAVVKVGVNNVKLENMIRPAYIVPESKNIDELFKELKNNKNHMAIIFDEYGGFSGIVTIEDLIEEVMGDILDEYDENKMEIDEIDNNIYLVDGFLTIDKVNKHLNLNLESKGIDTIGGFVINLIGGIPVENHRAIQYDNISFEVCKTSKKRIEKIKISLLQRDNVSNIALNG